ncbi:MAG: efflux RND transporter periplasmic adaptor subunit [Calditrichaeota bacterium]|nr:MAG: efflux RND transporter periplasmic adaptor subunit [Calditrichota bacterium]
MKNILLIIGLLIFISCGEPAKDESPADIPAPPSITEEKDAGTKLVTLSDKEVQLLKINTEKVRREVLKFNMEVPAFVHPSPENIFVMSAPINGIVVTINKHEGDAVKKGDVLLELESLEFANLVADYLQNAAEAGYRKSQYERTLQLHNQKIKSRKELDKSEVDFKRSEAAVQASFARLRAVGITDKEILNWKNNQSTHPHLPIRSPIAGVITEHLIDMGQAVESYQRMGTIVNNEKVMLKGYVAPEDGAFVKSGDKIFLSMRENDADPLQTVVHNIVPILDEKNRSITINAFYNNPPFWLKPGQNIRMQVQVSTSDPVSYIPVKAIQYEGNDAAVFVKLTENKFDKRKLLIERLAGDFAIIKNGVTADEEVAVSQVFALKALSKYGEYAD